MTKDYEKEAVEAMANAFYGSFYTNGEEFAAAEVTKCFGEGWAKQEFIDAAATALAADPLRQELGPAAVQALMEGKAMVFPTVVELSSRSDVTVTRNQLVDKPEEQKP